MAEPEPEAVSPPKRPEYVDRRIELFEKFAVEAKAKIAAMDKPTITIKFGDKECTGTAFEINVFQAAKAAKVDKKLINAALLAKVRQIGPGARNMSLHFRWNAALGPSRRDRRRCSTRRGRRWG